jgi:eukaryotic-like serine/threonine-protein kinase
VIVFSRFGSGLARVPAAGGVPVELTRLDVSSGEVEHTGPRFLPDNRHFLYNRRTSAVNTGAGVYVGSIDMKPDDARPARLVSTDFIPGYAPGPSPDAGYLLFLRDRTLFAQRFNLGRLVVEGQAVPVLEHVADNGPPFAIFSTSQTGVLAYRRNVATSGTVVWVDRTGREVGPAVTGTLTTPRFPRLSPDGERLALTVAGDIWVHDIGGRPPIRITSSGGNFETVWSSDGRRLVYETSSGTLSAIAADGSAAAPTPITERGHTHVIGFPRDGQELVAVTLGSASTGNDIVGLQVGAKAAPRPIVQTPAREGSDGAALSPDGRWLAYVSDVTGQREIWVQAYPAAGAPVRVSPNGGIEPVWSRKADELYYLEGTRMMGVAVRPGPTFDFKAAVRLFDSRYEHVAHPPTYDVGADGRFLMIKSERIDRPAINVVVNWPELLKGRR